jgi:hypothetical protein
MLGPIAALDTGGRRDDGKEKLQWIDEVWCLRPLTCLCASYPWNPFSVVVTD